MLDPALNAMVTLDGEANVKQLSSVVPLCMQHSRPNRPAAMPMPSVVPFGYPAKEGTPFDLIVTALGLS